MFGHEDVGGDTEALFSPDLFEDGVESVFCVVRGKEGLAAVTTKGDEVVVDFSLISFEA